MKFNFCPDCGTRLTEISSPQTCSSCGQIHYQNSKPTVNILPIQGDKVLLCVRGRDPHKGEMDTIGGFLEYGEDPLACARREAKEETGLDIIPKEILNIYPDTYGNGGVETLNISYLGEIVSGEMKAMDDVAELKWVPIADLPPADGFESCRKMLADLKDWYQKK